jgi:putative ABC transport system substrate-binding protein
MDCWSRRQFVQGVVGLGLLAGCGRLPWQGDQPSRVYRVGLLSLQSQAISASSLDALVQDLRERGYTEGQNITVEPRYADGNEERLPGLAAELVRLDPDVILTVASAATLAAKNATSAIPIVFVQVGNPVATGLVASLARPGGHATGLSGFGPELAGKRLQLLKDVAPGLASVAVLRVPSPANAFEWQELQTAGEALGLRLRLVEAHSPDDLDGALQTVVDEYADALFVMTGDLINLQSPRIIEFATRSRLPSMWTSRSFVAGGALMAYGFSTPLVYWRAAYYVDRILKGTKPADLPVEQPMTFDFVVNLQTAQALGLTIPQHVLLQATEVIQ